MTNIIIVVAIIAIIALLVVRSRQNKESSGVKSKKASSKTTAKTSAKSTKKAEPEPAPVAEPVAPKIDLNTLMTKVDLLINDKEFAKAEGLINQTLKQDSSLQPLYEKLLVIYHAQEDEFAVKQLLETLQKLNLNETYQRVYDDHEAFKVELSKREAANAANKTPDVFEFTPSTPDNSASFDSLTSTQNDTDLRFASLDTDVVAPAPADTTLDFNLSTPTPVPSGVHNVDFHSTTAPAKETVAEVEAPTLDFQLDPTPTINTEKTEVEAPTLDFNIEIPKEEKPAINPNIEVEAPTLDFNIEIPKEEKPAINPNIEVEAPTLDFNIEITKEEKPVAESLSFSLDTPTPTPAPLDINLADLTGESIVAPEATPEAAPVVTTGYADANDPVVQSFTELNDVNPVDLDIQLAEQYIRLGAIDAAKSILTTNHQDPSAEQLEKIGTLLQKIA